MTLFAAVVGLAVPVGSPAAEPESSAVAAVAQVPDSVRQQLSDGRFWKASRALRTVLTPLESASLSDRLLLAEAEAGWRNWEGSLAALSAKGIDTAQAPPRFWYLLGSARQASGDQSGAAVAFRRFVEASAAPSTERLAALSRLARHLAENARHDEAVSTLAQLAHGSERVAAWTALAMARTLAGAGAAEEVARVIAAGADSVTLARAWSLESDAWAASGDTATALAALDAVRLPRESTQAATALLGRTWRYRLALGDSTGAVSAMEELLRRTTAGAEALAAANAHWRVARGSGPEILKVVATAFGRGLEFGPAARAWRVAVQRGAELTESERLALARAHSGSGDRAAAVEIYRELSASEDPDVGLAALDAWRSIRTRQGRHGDARILQERLLERYPASREAVDIVFFRGDDHQDAGRLNQAVEQYRLTTTMLPAADRAGLARMRWAQIHLTRGEAQEAAAVFRSYLEEFPEGRRWEEASYWAAHAASAAGDTTGNGALLARLINESPLSYYAHLAAEAAGSVVPLPEEWSRSGPAPPNPEWLVREVQTIEVLDEAGLTEGAGVQTAHLKTAVTDSAAASGSSEPVLALAREFIEMGRVIDGIRLGLELRDRGEEWSRDLLEVVYPFPFRGLITARADEMGLDPYLVAGLIRQESAFAPSIGSSAGAIGLMQIMPPTGRQLARAVGPRGYTTESLRTAEVNVHLGTRYLAELLDRYDGYIPLVLSAYNAGPTRANRWQRFPEAEDPHRLTERIPFVETRGYVKSVVRNRALYRWLYGPGGSG